MDYFLKKEIDKLNGEKNAANVAIESEKYMFERKLKNGLGHEIIEALNSPPKPNWWLGLKIKVKRWILKRK